MKFAAPLERLIEALRKLPGVGAKSAQRLAFHILRGSADDARALASAIIEVKETIRLCSVCFNITDTDPCLVCADASRSRTEICVVEEPHSLVAIEKSGFRGLYHVLHGSIAPLRGIGPEDLKAAPLIERLRDGSGQEGFLATLLITLASAWLGGRLTLDGDVLNLVPRNNRVINTFREALQDFGSLDYFLLLLEARRGQTVDELQDFADHVAEELQHVPSIQYVEHKIDISGPFFSFFRTNQILFLPPSKLDELAAKFTDAAIRERVKENFRQLTGPSSFLVKQLLEQDPFQVSSLVFKEVLRSKGPLKVDLSSGYYLSKDGSALLIIAKPVRPAQDIAFDKRLMDEVRGAVAAASAKFEADLKEQAGESAADAGTGGATAAPAGARAPEVSFGGGYIIALEDSTLIMNDMLWNGTVSFIVILGLYYFCYRRFGAILYSSVPLLVGQILTLAAASLFLRNLNSATTGFSAMLMGLGTDFTIVMYARYVEERTRGKSLEESLRLMMGVSAFGVFTGAITSAGTFYAMCVTEYKGLRDFGFLEIGRAHV